MSALASQLIKSGALKTLLANHTEPSFSGPVRKAAFPGGAPAPGTPGAPAAPVPVPVQPPPFESKPQSKKAELAQHSPHPELAESKSLPMLQQIALEMKRAQLSSV
jgi:hypothetical protein